MGTMETLSHHVKAEKGASRILDKLSREDVNELPLFHYTGKIVVIQTRQDLAYAMKRLVPQEAAQGESVFGFDTETRPSFCKGKTYTPSLVQLSTAEEVFLFQLRKLPLSQELISLLESPGIIKTGVAAHEDMRGLTRLLPFEPQSVVDLNEVARKNGIECQGLRKLAAAFMGVRISKGEQCSNWANPELSARQIRYAATDAWVSRIIYLRMREASLNCEGASQKPNPSAPRPSAAGRARPRRVSRKILSVHKSGR